jgi:hypothetical protein
VSLAILDHSTVSNLNARLSVALEMCEYLCENLIYNIWVTSLNCELQGLFKLLVFKQKGDFLHYRFLLLYEEISQLNSLNVGSSFGELSEIDVYLETRRQLLDNKSVKVCALSFSMHEISLSLSSAYVILEVLRIKALVFCHFDAQLIKFFT